MKKLVPLTILILLAAGCTSTAKQGPMAMALLSGISGTAAMGTVHFQELADGSVEVSVDLRNVPPGVHGFHVHDKGDCGDNGNNAGGHFNPAGVAHGAPEAMPHHSGDFGNVTADAAGLVKTTFTTRSITVSPGANSVVGHAVILHANPDDLTTQPTGNAGARISCGVATAHETMAGSMHH